MSTCLLIQNLSVSYITDDGLITPVNDISFELDAGKFYGLIGASGSGKSTLIKAIGRVLPSNSIVSKGAIIVEGKQINGQGLKRSDSLGIVLQDPYASLNPSLRIKTQFRLTYGLVNSLMHPREFEKITSEMMAVVNLDPKELNKYPSQLSGGMNQRINIALSMMKKPRLLILDEPTSALDAHLKFDLMELISNIQKKLGICVLLISHDIKLVQSYAEQIFILSEGKLHEYRNNSMLVDLSTSMYTPCSNEVLVECDRLTKIFNGKKILNELSFTVHRGDCLGIVGPSGSGKSTICKILTGLYSPDSGRIISVKKLNIEMLFQDAGSSLDPTMTIRRILNEAAILSKNDKLSDGQLIQWLNSFSLPQSLLNHYPQQLSGGQRQMIAMLRILLSSPDIIILDEPTSSMDVFMQKKLLDFLKKILTTYKLTYILVSHDMDVISYMCNSIIELSDAQK